MKKEYMEKAIKNEDVVEAMHTIVRWMNNEDAYMRWIVFVPDEPTNDDFAFIGDDEKDRDFAWNLFADIVGEYADDGICWD